MRVGRKRKGARGRPMAGPPAGYYISGGYCNNVTVLQGDIVTMLQGDIGQK